MKLRAFVRGRLIEREVRRQPTQEPLSIHIDMRSANWTLLLNEELDDEGSTHPDVLVLGLAKRDQDGTRLYHETSLV